MTDAATYLAELKCDCCKGLSQAEVAGVCSSSIGAVSFAFCIECLKQNAEPEMMLEYLYYTVGDHGRHLSDHVKDYRTYKDGKYITWDEYCEWCKTQPDPDYVKEGYPQ